MSFIAKVGPKGQAVIPKPLRDKMGIQPGDVVTWTVHDHHITLEKRSAEDGLERFFDAFPKRRLHPDDVRKMLGWP